MLTSEAEEQIKGWDILEARVYKYYREFLPYEYITFRRNLTGDVVCDTDRSTLKTLDKFTEEEFLKLVKNGEMQFIAPHNWSTDVHRMKTGGCDCGAWALRDNEYLHKEKGVFGPACPLYKPRFKP